MNITTRKIIVLVFAFSVLISPSLYGQLTIESCQDLTRHNYPMIKQLGLIEQSRDYTLANASKSYLPQFSISARSTYQSEVTKLPQSLIDRLNQIAGQQNGDPVQMSVPGRDQYQVVAEVNQLLWDGGNVSAQKGIATSSSEFEKQKIEVELYTLKERVAQLFFGILAMEQQTEQIDLLIDELQVNYLRVQALLNNGMVKQSDLDAVKAEELYAVQKRFEMKAGIKAFREMLFVMTGDSAVLNNPLVKPDYLLKDYMSSTEPRNDLTQEPNYRQINRPELAMLESQKSIYDNRKKSIITASMPKLSLFAQGGYGNPGLNMLESGFTSYYILGARFIWNFGNMYTQKNNLRNLEINKKQADVLKERFIFNTQLQISQTDSEIEKLSDQLSQDTQIIALRKNILKSAESGLSNGTLTVTDVLREINALNSARTEKEIREINLLMAIYNRKNITNN